MCAYESYDIIIHNLNTLRWLAEKFEKFKFGSVIGQSVQGDPYKAGNLAAYKAGHLAGYKATHPSIWVRQWRL